MSSDDLFGRAENGERLRLEPSAPPTPVRQGIDWRLLGVMLLVTILAALAGAVLYAYSVGVRTSGEVVAPLIKAAPGVAKRKPDDPGGMAPPHQDKLVFDRVAPVEKAPQAEHLRPEPEEPLRSATAPEPEGEPPSWVAEDEAPPVPIVSLTPKALPQERAAPEPEQEAAPEAGAPAEAPEVIRTAEAAEPAESAAAPEVIKPAESAESAAAPEKIEPAEAAEPAEPAPTQEAAVGRYRVQLAAMRSEALAGRAWERLAKSYADLLADLQHFVERADLGQERGVFYRVQVGPFPNKAEAGALCAALRQRDASCFVVDGS